MRDAVPCHPTVTVTPAPDWPANAAADSSSSASKACSPTPARQAPAASAPQLATKPPTGAAKPTHPKTPPPNTGASAPETSHHATPIRTTPQRHSPDQPRLTPPHGGSKSDRHQGVNLRPASPAILRQPEEGPRLIVLLCGGDKSSQDRDISEAHRIAEEWRSDEQDD